MGGNAHGLAEDTRPAGTHVGGTQIETALGAIEATRRRLEAQVGQLAELLALAAAGPGFDGAPPLIVDAPHPDKQDRSTVKRNAREHPLDLMHHKGQLDAIPFQAADRLRVDLELALLSPMRCARLDSIYTRAGPAGAGRGKARAPVRAGEAGEASTAAVRAGEAGEASTAPVRAGEAGQVSTAAVPRGAMTAAQMFRTPVSRPVGAWSDIRPATLDAVDRVNRALGHVMAALGPRYGRPAAEVLMLLLRDRRQIREIEALGQFGRQDHIRKKLLKPGLAALADHYGLAMTARPGRVRGAMWGE